MHGLTSHADGCVWFLGVTYGYHSEEAHMVKDPEDYFQVNSLIGGLAEVSGLARESRMLNGLGKNGPPSEMF